MSDRFDVCHPITAKWEGGWSNNPEDPGGPTHFGVTQATYNAWRKAAGLPQRSIAKITAAEALQIYRKNYWAACGAPNLFPGVDLAVYDASVNSGVSRGRKWLKGAIGGSNDETVKRICRARLSFVQSLAIWKSFGRGWARRIADIEVKGVAMALAAMGATSSRIQADANAEAEVANKNAASSKRAATTTGGGAVASGGAPVVDPSAPDWATIGVLCGFCALLIIITVYFVARHRAAAARERAYREAAHA